MAWHSERAGRRVRVHPNAFGGMNGTTFRKVDGVDMRLPSLGPRTGDQSSWRCGAEMGRWERRGVTSEKDQNWPRSKTHKSAF